MYTTHTSTPATWAEAKTVEPGLTREVNVVLCCPAAVVALATVAMSAGVAYAAGTAGNSSSSDSGETAVLQSTYAAAYIAPGRITPSNVEVRDDASLEQLLAASR